MTASQSNSDGSEIDPEEEEEEEEDNGFFSVECSEKEDLVADIVHGGQSLLFLPTKSHQKHQVLVVEEGIVPEEPKFEDPVEIYVSEELFFCSSPPSESKLSNEDVVEEEFPPRDINIVATVRPIDQDENGHVIPDEESQEDCHDRKTDKENFEANLSGDEHFLIFAPPQLETRKLLQAQESVVEENYRDSYTSGSTSKSSSEWRNSINYRDSGTEDPFSSSSRRSCPNWESFTVFRKYDEEMAFLNQISEQKLSETESLKAIEVCPRSMSQRIVHKLTPRNKKYKESRRNPYHELEAAYVAQICLAWEALNWNYKNYQRLILSRHEEDVGSPGQIAQQFQQFQVLLQRYIENEPYEHGRRPEVFARLRISAPKLLQVPEFRDSEDDRKEEGLSTKVSSAKFLMIMENAMQIFMNFLKADKEKHFRIFKSFLKKKHRSSVDPALLHLMKKENRKKKMKLKDLCRTRKCLRKRRLKQEEETEILMGLIDLKVVSRVLRMHEISEEQLHWCEEKMRKVSVWDGKLQRDSSPLFFPAH